MRRQGMMHLCADADARLVSPEPGNVAGRVPAAAEDEKRQVELLGEGDAGAVCLDVQIEATEPVAAEGVAAALEHDGGGLVDADAGPDNVLEELDVLLVFDAVVQRDVEGVVGARVGRVAGAGAFERAGAGEEILLVVFVEGEGHDAIGGPEGLFDAVAVVDVDVDVEDARVVDEELEDGEYDVVDVAESRGFVLFGVV